MFGCRGILETLGLRRIYLWALGRLEVSRIFSFGIGVVLKFGFGAIITVGLRNFKRLTISSVVLQNSVEIDLQT